MILCNNFSYCDTETSPFLFQMIPLMVSCINIIAQIEAGTDAPFVEVDPCFYICDVVATFYFSSCRTVCGSWLAWANIAVAAWFRMLNLVKFIISLAMSTSRIRDSAAVRFSVVVARLLIE